MKGKKSQNYKSGATDAGTCRQYGELSSTGLLRRLLTLWVFGQHPRLFSCLSFSWPAPGLAIQDDGSRVGSPAQQRRDGEFHLAAPSTCSGVGPRIGRHVLREMSVEEVLEVCELS